MKKLYVGNLAWAVTDEDLQSLFSEHGGVASASVITDRETGLADLVLSKWKTVLKPR